MQVIIDDLIGTPFNELKCWELIEEVYYRGGIKLKHYSEYYPDMDEWIEVAEPMEGTLLVFALEHDYADHVGVSTGDGCFVHSTKVAGVCIEKLSRYRTKLLGMYDFGGKE